MTQPDTPAEPETYNPWTVVNLVFEHLADRGLHPVLGGDDPGGPAAALLEALGITPAPDGDRTDSVRTQAHLAELREAMFPDA